MPKPEENSVVKAVSSLKSFIGDAGFTVRITMMKESHRVTYWVILERKDRPDNASIFDGIGRMTPYQSVDLENVKMEAEEWATFLGTTVEPFNKEH